MIVSIPNPVLTTPAKTVMKIDKKILDIVGQMKKELLGAKKPKGVGLAAPQIGISLKIFITRPTEKTPVRVFLNPEITWYSPNIAEVNRPAESKAKYKDKKLEGCLSIPNIWGHLLRPDKIRLKYLDLDGSLHEEEFEDFLATIIQHETDHTNGILFTRRVLEQKEKLFTIETDENGEEKLEEIEV